MAGTFNGAVPAPSVEHGYHFHFGNIEKRLNSTKAFDYGVLKDLERCDFKKPTSMEHPVIYCTINSINISPQWNYCHCEETKSFYWIDDITTLRANIWQISLSIDPLATYREAILKTKTFIEYGFNSDASGATFRLQDARQNVARRPTVSTVAVDITDGNLDPDTGVYMLSCVGKGGLATYAVNQTTMNTLLTALSALWEAETKVMVDWKLALPEFMNKFVFGSSAVENIRSCYWLPINFGRYGAGRQTPITLGGFDTAVSGRIVSMKDNRKVTTAIPIPWPADDWKRMNCQIQVYVPNIGVVGIPVDQCNDAVTVDIEWCLTLIDGSVTVRVSAGDYTAFVGSTNISSPYGIGASNIDPIKAMGGASTIVGGAMEFGGGVGAAILTPGLIGKASGVQAAMQGAATAAEGLRQTITPITQSVGFTAGASQTLLPTEARLTLLYYPPIDDAGYQGLYGYPVMKVATPVSGYCKTRGFSCQPEGAMPDEIAYINRAMDSGVFIE